MSSLILKKIFFIVLGIGSMLFSRFWQESVVTSFFSSDGVISSPLIEAAIHAGRFFFLVFGIVLLTVSIFFQRFFGKLFRPVCLFLYIGFSLIFILFASEFSLRFLEKKPWNYPPHTRWYASSKEFQRIATVNNIGVRGEDFISGHSSTKILVVGDSFVFGEGVSDYETMPRKLQSLFRKHRADTLVVNAGKTGAAPFEYREIVQKYFPQVKPNLVILCIFLGNDFPYFFLGKFSYPIRVEQYFSHIVERFFFHNDTQQKKLRTIIDREFFHRDGFILGSQQAENFHDSFLLRGSFNRPYILQDALVRFDKGRIMKNLEIVRGISRYVQNQGAEFIVVLIPVACQVRADYLMRYRQAGFILKDAVLTERFLQNEVARFLHAQKIPFLDLLDSFRHDPGQLYYWQDIHCTPYGYQRMAEEIINFLTKKPAPVLLSWKEHEDNESSR